MAFTYPVVPFITPNHTLNTTANQSAVPYGIVYSAVPPHDDQWWLRVTFVVFMGILSAFGTVGNLFVICSILLVKELRKVKNCFILNLGISDLTINAISMPINIIGALHAGSYWYGRDSLCTFVSAICIPGCSSSLYSIAAIAFERYICICHPGFHHKLFTLPNAVIMVTLLWVNAHLIHLPNHIGWGDIYYDENFFLCWLDLRLWSYSFFYASYSVLIPIGFSFYAYFNIYWTIRSTNLSRKLITKSSSKGENDTEKQARSAWLEEVMLVKTLFRLFVIFLISWGPVAVLFCFNKLIHPPRWINLLAIMMAHGNSATNSVVYYWLNGHASATLRSARTRISKKRGDVYPLKGKATGVTMTRASDVSRGESRAETKIGESQAPGTPVRKAAEDV
ncbi:adenosine receptor A1-like isoform X2 [Paramacrobiotus metropolitanus]|uniref:adenosine receptor A1-like isoform X2 n=1 Tax=Paramacrobiotus metropolitanus TaxID=2943436 RepID=UPI002446578C|nr:adenosine receptor A1-like isoform X2 [Paramacrobiotus metropolitanus]